LPKTSAPRTATNYGGLGCDTLRIVLTESEAGSAAIQADLHRYRDFLAKNADPKALDCEVFEFKAFDLKVRDFEKLDVVVEKPTAMPVVSIAALSADKAEGTDGTTPFTFTITRTGDTSVASEVAWTVSGSTAVVADAASAADFQNGVFATGKVQFAAGQTTAQTVTVNVNADAAEEPNEGFQVTLSGAQGASIDSAKASAQGVIRNDDAPPPPLPVVSIAAVSADKAEGTDGTTPFTFTITRTGDTSVASEVTWTVSGSTAVVADAASAADFQNGVFATGKVQFAAGQTTAQTVTVNVNADAAEEPNEGFQVTLSDAQGASIDSAKASAQGVIRNDDGVTAEGIIWQNGGEVVIGTVASPTTFSIGTNAAGPTTADRWTNGSGNRLWGTNGNWQDG
jgi:hypothetical protein